ncbi:MAG: alpha/beta-hydrolase family protein [Halioglobus sp.]|nr:alpha/beta-hydrolase family protein [Halioglobus sp.]
MLSNEYIRSIFRLSIVGVLLGTVFLSVSLTPSLLPRPPAVQGLLAGVSFAIGYGFGVAGLALWKFLQLPLAAPRLSRLLTLAAGVLCALIAAYFLWQASSWQDSLRAMMGMEDSAGLRPAAVGPVAALVFAVLLTLARLFRRTFHFLSRQLARYVPPRISQLVGIVLAVLLFWSAVDGVLFNFLLRTADQSFAQLDALIEDDLPRPSRPEQTGSAESLVAWQQLGRQGRRFISSGPDAAELSAFFGTAVPAPVRVYVGLNSADTPGQRARLALEELKRAGGFERSVLLLVTPTGTGWVDEASQDPAEYLFRGDVATVAVQYSYLNSPLALLTQAAYGAESARAVFVEIYGYWRSLPVDARPRLFLNGLSLGSLNSDLSFNLFDIIDAPFSGALWSGPPFRNDSWRRMTRDREPGSPAWLPRYRGGAVARFMNQTSGPVEGYAAWNDFRIVFLQYASDPITFFDPSIAWSEPAWMREPRGPDVSPDLRWFPVVTMLQLAADMVVGTAPRGFGHEYAPADYIEAWLALAEPEGWTPSELERLRGLFE